GSILITGGFSGSLDCIKDQIVIKSAGEITVSEHTFSILDYRYRLTPVECGAAVHGGQRLLIIEDGRVYLGQFVLDTPPFHSVMLQGSTVYIDRGTVEAGQINFSAKGPPNRAYLN